MTAPDKRHARGFTLLEFMIVTVLTAIALLGLVQLWKANQRTVTNAAVAAQLKTISSAADAYTKANRAALIAAAGPTTPVSVTYAQLIASGGLDPNFPLKNAYGQNYLVAVIQPSAGSLYTLVSTYGGTNMSGDDVVEAAQLAVKNGVPAGYTSGVAPVAPIAGCTGSPAAYSRGAFGDWCTMLAPFGLAGTVATGHVQSAIFFANAATVDDYLHRSATPGSPELNRMSTAIDMATNNITNGGTIAGSVLSASGNVTLNGASIVGSAANLSLRAPGAIYIQNPSLAATDIAVVRNITDDGTGQFVANGIVARSQVYSYGSVYSAGQISTPSLVQGGTVTSTGETYTAGWFRSGGDTGWYSTKWGGGWYMADSTWLRAYGDKGIYTGGQIQGGSVVSNGRMTANEYLQVVGGAATGGGCSPNGLLGRASDGTQLVQCKNGVWSRLGGYSNFTIVIGPNQAGLNNSLATCPAGWTMLSGGSQIMNNPYGELPGAQSYPFNSNTWLAESTDVRVAVRAYAFCAS